MGKNDKWSVYGEFRNGPLQGCLPNLTGEWLYNRARHVYVHHPTLTFYEKKSGRLSSIKNPGGLFEGWDTKFTFEHPMARRRSALSNFSGASDENSTAEQPRR